LAAGVVIEDQVATVHTCALGLQDVYLRQVGDALYFAVRIAPLTRLDDAPLHTDWQAWASIFALAGPIGATTPYTEIRRIEAATAWRVERGSATRLRFEPAWFDVSADPVPEPGQIVELIGQQLAGLNGDEPAISVTLSGGWDSRLLATVARRCGRQRVRAWTSSVDDGLDLDIEFAGSVAKALDIQHEVIVPGSEAWLADRRTVRERVQYQTWMHTWAMPLARRLHCRGEYVLDGLAGDILLKSLHVDPDVVQADSPATARRLLWNHLSDGRLAVPGGLASGVVEFFEEASRAAFDEATAHLDGHPAAPALSVLLTRTARAIGPLPGWLFGPEANVLMPFIHPEVITTAVRVPALRKIGGDFYRAVLANAEPTMATLPSTNDPGPEPFAKMRRETTFSALTAMADAISSADTVCRLLGPSLQHKLRDRDALRGIWRQPRELRALQWASMLAEWLNKKDNAVVGAV
jgi:hypothetical protein